VVFALSALSTDGLPLDTHQRFELLITAAQSLFAVSILVNLGLTISGAVTLFVLFAIQFTASIVLPTEADRVVIIAMSALYGILAIGQFARRRRQCARIVRDGIMTPFQELTKQPS
jgi:cation:H+ antiporter